jgi:hypothetical protein
VQLFRVSGPPIAVILQNIRTTWDACFITWNKAYCLFPVSSFITHEPFLLAPLKEVTTPDEEGKVLATREHLTRAHEWGRRIKTGLWQLDTGNKLVPLKELGPYRQLGDKHSWIINLDTKGVKSNPDRPDFLLENMRTFLRHTHDDSPVSYLDPSHYFIESCVLRHAYIACDFSNAAHHPACMCLPDERKTHEQGVQQLLKMLQEATVVQLMMLDEDKMPAEYAAIMADSFKANDAMGTFEVPDDWECGAREAREAVAGVAEG